MAPRCNLITTLHCREKGLLYSGGASRVKYPYGSSGDTVSSCSSISSYGSAEGDLGPLTVFSLVASAHPYSGSPAPPFREGLLLQSKEKGAIRYKKVTEKEICCESYFLTTDIIESPSEDPISALTFLSLRPHHVVVTNGPYRTHLVTAPEIYLICLGIHTAPATSVFRESRGWTGVITGIYWVSVAGGCGDFHKPIDGVAPLWRFLRYVHRHDSLCLHVITTVQGSIFPDRDDDVRL
uniref:Uncharacterized protein n=1 Tax=Timema genevievae TaxID=629358 RepID=A0A7R9JZP3_TIMGE|nr:unnamed protein product [Timema genevievae]